MILTRLGIIKFGGVMMLLLCRRWARLVLEVVLAIICIEIMFILGGLLVQMNAMRRITSATNQEELEREIRRK